MIVLDASAVLPWFLAEEMDGRLDAILIRVRHEGAAVPGIWPLEVANAMRTAIRKRRMLPSQRDAALTELSRLRILVEEVSTELAWGPTLALSDRHNLTLYDAAYLELALRRRLPLASLDAELRAAAAAEGVIALPV